jgi:hypothetical protein
MDAREETTDAPGMQQVNKGPRRKTTATSEEGGDIRQDHQEDRTAGDQMRIVVPSIGLREVSYWTLRRGQPPPKRRDVTSGTLDRG